MESLFGSLPEMLDFQRVFLQTLEERIASSPDFSTLETPSQFKVRPRRRRRAAVGKRPHYSVVPRHYMRATKERRQVFLVFETGMKHLQPFQLDQ